MEKAKTVEEFTANASPEARPLLLQLREMIMDTFPDIEERIGYGVPQYKYHNKNLGISVAKKHVTIGFDFGVITDLIRKELEQKGYKLGLQTLQIKFIQDIPRTEINKLFVAIKNS